MTNALTLAAATTNHGSSIPSPFTVVLVVAAVGYVLWSRMQGRPLRIRRLIVLPIILAVFGLRDLTGSSAPHLTPQDIAFLLISVGVSAVLGVARGATIQIYSNQGELWQRYRKSTVGLWVALIVAKIVLFAIARSAGASAGGGTSSLLLSLGVSLLAEAAIVGPRASSTGLPFAGRGSGANGSRIDSDRSGQGPVDGLPNDAATRTFATDTSRVVRPPAAQIQPERDHQDQWDAPRTYDRCGSNRRRSGRRRGPIHRLLGADSDQRTRY